MADATLQIQIMDVEEFSKLLKAVGALVQHVQRYRHIRADDAAYQHLEQALRQRGVDIHANP